MTNNTRNVMISLCPSIAIVKWNVPPKNELLEHYNNMYVSYVHTVIYC